MSEPEQGARNAAQPQIQPQPLPRSHPSAPASGSTSRPHGPGGDGGGFAGILDGISGSRAATLAGGAAVMLVAGAWAIGLLAGSDPGTAPAKPAGQSTAAPASSVQMIRQVTGADVDKALAMLAMPEADKARAQAELQKGKLRIGLVTVSDTHDEDGDWVRVAGAGFQQDIRLFHKPHTIAVPYLPGMPISVIGLVDGGGGGITVAVYVGAAKLSLKPMQKGEQVQIPTP